MKPPIVASIILSPELPLLEFTQLEFNLLKRIFMGEYVQIFNLKKKVDGLAFSTFNHHMRNSYVRFYYEKAQFEDYIPIDLEYINEGHNSSYFDVQFVGGFSMEQFRKPVNESANITRLFGHDAGKNSGEGIFHCSTGNIVMNHSFFYLTKNFRKLFAEKYMQNVSINVHLF